MWWICVVFQAFVAIGDSNGHIGLGVKCSKEVATAIRGAIILAKLSVIPVRRGYWGNKIGKPHTVPCKVRILAFFMCGFLLHFGFKGVCFIVVVRFKNLGAVSVSRSNCLTGGRTIHPCYLSI